MPNTTVLAISGAMPAWSPIMSNVARTILHAVTSNLEGIRADVEHELAEHNRCRRDVEALIERLIAGLDEVDGDADLEGHPSFGAVIDPDLEIDVADEPHDERDQADDEPSLGWSEGESLRGITAFQPLVGEFELTATETHGAGFFNSGPDDAEDGADHEHVSVDQDGGDSDVWPEECSGIFASFKRGQLVHVHTYGREGRAPA
jgi:hypothetical protein